MGGPRCRVDGDRDGRSLRGNERARLVPPSRAPLRREHVPHSDRAGRRRRRARRSTSALIITAFSASSDASSDGRVAFRDSLPSSPPSSWSECSEVLEAPRVLIVWEEPEDGSINLAWGAGSGRDCRDGARSDLRIVRRVGSGASEFSGDTRGRRERGRRALVGRILP